MNGNRRPSDTDLEEMAARAKRVAEGSWRHVDGGGLDLFVLRNAKSGEIAHLYARKEVGEALTKAAADVSRLTAELRKERAEATSLREHIAKLEAEARAETRGKGKPAATPDIGEEAFALLAAPFRVSPKTAKAAQTDPLLALAVQVARALQQDAKDIERARLIAMAFAATTGDKDAFWAARRQRSGKKSDIRRLPGWRPPPVVR